MYWSPSQNLVAETSRPSLRNAKVIPATVTRGEMRFRFLFFIYFLYIFFFLLGKCVKKLVCEARFGNDCWEKLGRF